MIKDIVYLCDIVEDIVNEAYFDDKKNSDEWEERLAANERRAKARDEAKGLLSTDSNQYGDTLKRFKSAKAWKSVTLDQLKKWMKLNQGFFITVIDKHAHGGGTRVPPIQITEPITNSVIPRQIATVNKGNRALGAGRSGTNMDIKFNSLTSIEAYKPDPNIIVFTFQERSLNGANSHTFKVLVTPKQPSHAVLVAFNSEID